MSDTERRRAFSVWVRTGRWPVATPSGDVEVKFNPWHDPADGRFTFAGSGRSYGRGDGNGSSSGGRPGSGGSPTPRSAPERHSRSSENSPKRHAAPALNPHSKTSLPTETSAGAVKPNLDPESGSTGARFTGGGGGSFGGGGASSTERWSNDPASQRQGSGTALTVGKQQTADSKTRLEWRISASIGDRCMVDGRRQ
jgi:hypothetical protein